MPPASLAAPCHAPARLSRAARAAAPTTPAASRPPFSARYFGLRADDGGLVLTACGAPVLEIGRLSAGRARRGLGPRAGRVRVVDIDITVVHDAPGATPTSAHLFALQMRDGRLVQTLTRTPHLFVTPRDALDAIDRLGCRRVQVVPVTARVVGETADTAPARAP